MSNKSFKQNINTNYYDQTSPLVNWSKIQEKTLLKKSIHNSFVNKIQVYSKKQQTKLNPFLCKNKSFQSLKASSILYKLPQFTIPQINYDISEQVRQKTLQIKQQLVTNLPQILNSSQSLPYINPTKSSNYNPKKLQNLLGHRSEILQLQNWLRNSLTKNPPTTHENLIQYKQMIMGIGMKDLIRVINKRCLEEGKLVQQIWQLTWGICKQIIAYMGKRVKTCQQLLTEEIVEFNKGCKRNFYEQQKELIDLRKKVRQYEQKQKVMTQKIEQLSNQNEKISLQSNKNYLQNNYFNEQFLNVLEENLAMYLHIGDKTKREWIKKMYRQVEKARQSIRKVLKDKVNVTVSNRIKKERVFEDEVEEKLEIDDEGNFAIESKKDVQNEQQPAEENYEGDETCQNLKNQLTRQFELKEAEVQTDQLLVEEHETQCEDTVLEEKQMNTEACILEEAGVNTSEQAQTGDNQNQKTKDKNAKNKEPKRKDKRNQKIMSKSKLPRLSSQLYDTPQSKNVTSISSTNSLIINKSQLTEEKQQEQKPQLIQYVCKQCYSKKNKQDALSQIRFQQKDQQRIQKQLSQHSVNSDKSFFNDQSDKNIVVARKHQTKRKSHLSRMSSINIKNVEPKASQSQVADAINEKVQKSKWKKVLSNISENKIIQDIQYESQLQTIEKKLDNFSNEMNQEEYTPHNAYLAEQLYIDELGKIRNKHSQVIYEGQNQMKDNKKKIRRRDSSILHDISFKKETQTISNLKEAGYNFINEDDQKNGSILARLPLTSKEPYFKFFTERITDANKDFISQINFLQPTNQAILNNYFTMVQQINSIPQSRIQMSEKQMLTIIEKNLMPIILQLLNIVKKSILKKNVEPTIRTFQSLPFILMNKFSTKYGVKILATKNMKLLLSSLKKIQLITDRYKSLRLMLFTDCRAMYSQDLFVYLFVLATITPHLDIQRSITYEQVNQVRQICQKYLTPQKKIYQDFDNMTKEALGFNRTKQKLLNLKLAPLLRSIITSYRMVKINRIEQLGFIFLMLKKQNFVQYQAFSFFLSYFKIETQIKVKITKTFLANCDIKTKQKKMAISQSGFSRFLIKCPQFNFEMLNSVILKQKFEFDKLSSQKTTKKNITTSKRMSQQPALHELKSLEKLNSRLSLKMDEQTIRSIKSNFELNSQSRLQTQKGILLSSQHYSSKPSLKQQIQINNSELWDNKQQVSQNNPISIYRDEKRQLSLNCFKSGKPQISQRIKQYSYFTYQISKFLQNEQETKYMIRIQKQFVENYLIVHVMNCQIDDMIGIIDYFSNEMLEIVCCDEKELRIESM